jgi:hypothetical protein
LNSSFVLVRYIGRYKQKKVQGSSTVQIHNKVQAQFKSTTSKIHPGRSGVASEFK